MQILILIIYMKKNFVIFSFVATALFCLLGSCAKPIYDNTGTVYGTITDSQTGTPVRNAEITLTPGNISSVSGSNGTYEYYDITPGQYKLSVSAHGYSYNSRQILVVAGQTTICDMLLYPEEQVNGITFSTTTLNFGSDYDELVLELYNNGNAGDISWNVSGIDVPWLSVTPSNGVVEMGKSAAMKVMVNRTFITQDELTFFNVNAAGGSKSIKVQVSEGNGGNSGGGGSDDNGGSNVVNGLYAYYKFEGDCKNGVDGAPNGQGINSPSYVDGLTSGTKAIKFSVSDNSYLSVPEPMIDGANYTISFWAKGISDGHIFHVVSSGQRDVGFILNMRNGFLTYMSHGQQFIYNYDNVRSFSHPTIDSSEWTMITLTSKYTTGVSTAEVKLYINGEYVDVINEESMAYQNVGYGVKFQFGGEMVYWSGQKSLHSSSMTIDNLRIYDTRVLSASEIEDIYNYEK